MTEHGSCRMRLACRACLLQLRTGRRQEPSCSSALLAWTRSPPSRTYCTAAPAGPCSGSAARQVARAGGSGKCAGAVAVNVHTVAAPQQAGQAPTRQQCCFGCHMVQSPEVAHQRLDGCCDAAARELKVRENVSRQPLGPRHAAWVAAGACATLPGGHACQPALNLLAACCHPLADSTWSFHHLLACGCHPLLLPRRWEVSSWLWRLLLSNVFWQNAPQNGASCAASRPAHRQRAVRAALLLAKHPCKQQRGWECNADGQQPAPARAPVAWACL